LRSALIESTHTKALPDIVFLHFFSDTRQPLTPGGSAFAVDGNEKRNFKNLLKRFGRNEKLITFATPTTTGQQTESESCG